jgi:polyisoprenoid-binding protein YceI
MEERIWKLSSRKKSIFLDSGVFHLNTGTKGSQVTGVRSSFAKGAGYERVVIDFSTPSVPRVYGHISAQNQKLSIDLFDTSVATAQPQLKNSKFVKNIDFISVDGKTLTMDIALKSKASFDVFYLPDPGRLVIDIR